MGMGGGAKVDQGWPMQCGWKVGESKLAKPPTPTPHLLAPLQPLQPILHVVKNLWVGGKGVFWRLGGSGGWCKVGGSKGRKRGRQGEVPSQVPMQVPHHHSMQSQPMAPMHSLGGGEQVCTILMPSFLLAAPWGLLQ